MHGAVPAEFNGAEVKMSGDDSNFQSVKIKVMNGRFELKGKIDQEFEHVYLSVDKDAKHLCGANFFIRNTEMAIKIFPVKNGNGQLDFQYTNVPFIKDQKKLADLTKGLQDSLAYAFNMMRFVENGQLTGYNKDSLGATVLSLRKNLRNRKIDFIEGIPHSYFSLYTFNKDIIKNLDIDGDSLLQIYSRFDTVLKQTKLGKSVYSIIKQKQSLAVNSLMPDFSFLTDQGSSFQLSSFRQKKYVLLCFWETGCKPCIQNIPFLKQLHAAYGETQLQLISVSLDLTSDRWRASLAKYAMPWLQTCDLPAFVHNTSLQRLYDVNYMPQYFLIDKDGRLIYQNIQLKDDDDYTILKKVIKTSLH